MDRPDGFEARYRSILNKLPDGQCEYSFDYFLKPNKNFTRYDEIINFDSDWKLGFWNEPRFNEYQWIEGNQIRERNPFEVAWRGNVLIPNDPELKLSIEYTGEGKIQLGNSAVSLPTEYLSKNIFLVDIKKILSKDLTGQNYKSVLPLRYSIVVWSMISAHLLIGKPKIPVLIAGKVILFKPRSSANFSEFNVAFFSF